MTPPSRSTHVIEFDDTVAIELALAPGDGTIAGDAVVIHCWANG